MVPHPQPPPPQTNGGDAWSASSLGFLYEEEPRVTGVTPNIGAAEGATAVLVAGINFTPSPRLVFAELQVVYNCVTYFATTILQPTLPLWERERSGRVPFGYVAAMHCAVGIRCSFKCRIDHRAGRHHHQRR